MEMRDTIELEMLRDTSLAEMVADETTEELDDILREVVNLAEAIETEKPGGDSIAADGEETANEQASEETMSGREAAGTVTSRNGSDSDGKTGTGDGLGSQQEQSVRLSSSGLEWPFPTKKELKGRLGEPRRFAQDPGADMTLAIRALGLYDVPVTSSNDDEALDRGAVHVPDTAYPWDREDQKNVFLAGHRLGSKKEKSRLLFYSLDELKPGDEIVLKDRKGQPYKYRVRELFKVGPNDAWVADTLVGRDLLTLQTYTLPDSEDRLVVRADRVQPRSEGGGEQRR